MRVLPSQGRAHGSAPSPPPVCGRVDLTPLRSLGLTPRECEVMRWISEGKRDREIAIILNLSHRTVSNHAHRIFYKLNVETRTAAVRHCAVALSQCYSIQILLFSFFTSFETWNVAFS